MNRAERQLAEGLRRWREHPQLMVRELFGVTPDAWQDDVLAAFPSNPRMAMKACKGPGKTTVLAWLAWNFLLTRPHPKIAATSVSADNLRDGLWTEMAKWRGKSPALQAGFEWTQTRIFHKEYPETWWMSARTWPKSADVDQQANTLAGLHADYLLFILDEAGGIPDAVMAAAEAGLSSDGLTEGHEAHLLMAGNPTHLEGPLYRACTSERQLWHVTEITADPDDPKRSPRVSVEWARQQILKYGAENPWVLVNVFGRFPPSSINSLIGPDDVSAAMARRVDPLSREGQPKILGVDVARQGSDMTVIFPRQGLTAFKPIGLRIPNVVQIAGHVAKAASEWGSDAEFVDATGGWGWGVIDTLGTLGREPVGVEFAGAATDPGFANKRAEMWWAMAEWIKGGGCLPDTCTELTAELTAATYSFRGDRILLEDKAQIAARIGRSPDYADSLALTFAMPVAPRQGFLGRGYRERPKRNAHTGY